MSAMSDPYLDDLCEQLARGILVVINGGGAGAATTAGNEVVSWSGLLRNGIHHVPLLHHYDDAWEQQRLAQLQGDATVRVDLAGGSA